MSLRALLIAGVMALSAFAAPAAETVREFDSPDQRERYYALLEQLRCLVCQNESLASSSADLAGDMRDVVYRLVVREGRSNEAAIEYLTDRYGDFVLYRPPVGPSTWLLWFGPALMLLIGAAVLAFVIRQRRQAASEGLSSAERERADRLLADEDDS
jgi:cytochrome c-type biogenesis protein CcmH